MMLCICDQAALASCIEFVDEWTFVIAFADLVSKSAEQSFKTKGLG